VVVAAFRKRRVSPGEVRVGLYENDEVDRPISLYGRLLHTGQLR
jgi:hypothetical protein